MRRKAVLLVMLVADASAAIAQASAHRTGPDGLEGWLISEIVESLEDQGPIPTELVISQYGRIVRHLVSLRPATRNGPAEGAFFGNLILLPDGKRVAYTNGPLHFGQNCTLMDIRSSKHLVDIDCYHDLPNNAPEWVRTLQNAPSLR